MAVHRSRQRRHHMRVQARWAVACQRIGRNGIAGEPFPAETLNLSAGGVGLLSEQPLFRPMRVAVRLDMGELDLVVRGAVTRVDARDEGRMAAIRFDPLPARDQLAITRFVMREARERGQLSRAIDPGTPRWWLPAA
jgi:c-di-GMP-binding flagellar brake protein YcgR